MAKLTIYGTPASRCFRVLWMAEELGLDYDLDPINIHKSEQNREGYDAVNPNRLVPSIKDGDFTLWESLAINLYFARKDGGPLAPKGLEDEMRATQWSMWALTRLEDPCVVLVQKAAGIVDHPDDKVAAARKAVKAPLAVLDNVLADRDYLLGGDFTVADLNVASVSRVLKRVQYDMSAYPNASAWLDRCMARPAYGAAAEMQNQAMKAA